MHYLLAALTFVMIFASLGIILALVGRRQPKSVIQGRLEAIEKGLRFGKTPLDLMLIRDELMSSIPTLNRFLQKFSWSTKLRKYVFQAGMQTRPGKLVLFGAAMAAVAFEATDLFYGKLLVSVLVGAVALFLPLAYVWFKRKRRLRAFEAQFPDVIGLLSRSVRAGHSFTAGMETVATDMSDPIAGEFRTTFDEQRFGLPIRDALLGLCERIPLVDVRFFVVALLVQKETGGNLAEILDNLAHVIRERARIGGEVRVRTAQGRLTAGILIAMPLGMLAMLKVINPDYVNILFYDPWGQYMLAGGAALQLFGSVILWRIVQINV
jgi:tight adherence protein B